MIQIRFQTKKLARICSSAKEMNRSLGRQQAKLLQQRLAELRSANSLEDMRYLPAAYCHELEGNRKGQFAVRLNQPFRLVFEPDHDPVPTKPDGGLDWKGITQIVILKIEDYH